MRAKAFVWIALVVGGALVGSKGCASGEEPPAGGDDDDSSQGGGDSGGSGGGGGQTASGGAATGGQAGSGGVGGAACVPTCQSAALSTDCCSGMLSVGVCVDGSCGLTGAPCDCAAECCTNVCNGGTCACKPDGSTCSLASDCCSNNCNAGICAAACAVVCGANCCQAGEICCGPPSNSCTCSMCPCPISRRAYKKDIRYLDPEEERRLHDELLRFPLAEYLYQHEGGEERPHLGFIIDDVEPTAATTRSADAVDLYGYATMAVAALKQQQRQIDELKREVQELRREVPAKGRRGSNR